MYARMWEAKEVKKRTNRLLRPGLGVYFVVMIGFCLMALLADQPLLAGIEIAVTAALYTSYLLMRKLRHRELLRFLEKSVETVESTGKGKSPFPAVVIRLSDSSIVWANDQFAKITGFSDLMTEQFLSSLLPDFATDWLIDSKTEAPYDATIHGHRYRTCAQFPNEQIHCKGSVLGQKCGESAVVNDAVACRNGGHLVLLRRGVGVFGLR